jgi:hypothetical protein
MNLFDDIVRTRTNKKGYSEADYPYLNQSARPQQERIRTLLDKWFVNFTQMNQLGSSRTYQDKLRNLWTEFRSKDTRKHWGAFFELYCHEFLCAQGYKVEVEPTRGILQNTRR